MNKSRSPETQIVSILSPADADVLDKNENRCLVMQGLTNLHLARARKAG